MKKYRLTAAVLCFVLAAAAAAALWLLRPQEKDDFSWKPFDKAYFAFVLDDTNEYTAPMYRLFHEKGVPMSAAAISGMLYTPAEGMDGTIVDILHLIEEDGGEVLAHYSGNLSDPGYRDGDITFETSDAAWQEKTVAIREELISLGLNIRGIIRADYSQTGSRKGERICREYYEYSDGLGRSAQYDIERTYMMAFQSEGDFRWWIDESCKTPGFYPICFHGWEEIADPETVAGFLDYILTEHPDDAEITTYAAVYDRFGQLEK